MRVFDLKKRLAEEGGETVLGAKDLGTHNCYLIYGEIRPGEDPRLLKPGRGHEEIICVVSGEMVLTGAGESVTLGAGETIFLKDEESLTAVAIGAPCVYVAAGGHTAEGSHHHH